MTPSPRKSRGILRFLAFFLIPALAITAANTLLLRTDAHSYYTFLEMTQTDDIDLALVGSSIVFADFNPEIITEQTGLNTFSVTIGHMSMPGALAATRLMYKTHTPSYVALVVESDNFSKTTEDIQTQMRLSPFLLKHPLISLRYYLDLCTQDQKYLDRILLFKSFFARDLNDVKHSIALRTRPEEYYPESGLTEGMMTYAGNGFLRYMADGDGDGVLRFTPLRPQHADANDGLQDVSKRKLIEYKKLCEKNGSELLVIISPNITAQGLGRAGFLNKNVALTEFCQEENIPCYDMSMARPEFIPPLDDYYYDWYHLSGKGADIFSSRFSEFMNMYIAGEPVDHLFYATLDEYLDSIDFITNTWIDKHSENGTDVYTAGCLHGRTISPEYAFYLLGEDGSHELLRPYSADAEYRCETGLHDSKEIRVYARPQGSGEELTHIYNDYQNP
ncbi:MAG: hypothetical protein IJB85_00490 [Clostridia bacterium]|nr:hypothetical protein [Clostridia bacterium]